MADFADLASELSEQQFEQAMLRAKTAIAANQRKMDVFKGICLNCEQPISVGTVCDEYCREDYQNRMRK